MYHTLSTGEMLRNPQGMPEATDSVYPCTYDAFSYTYTHFMASHWHIHPNCQHHRGCALGPSLSKIRFIVTEALQYPDSWSDALDDAK